MGNPIVLASRSPQRRAILEQLGIDFTAVTPGVEEQRHGEPQPFALKAADDLAGETAGEGIGLHQDERSLHLDPGPVGGRVSCRVARCAPPGPAYRCLPGAAWRLRPGAPPG